MYAIRSYYGIDGPSLEQELSARGYTLGHFPELPAETRADAPALVQRLKLDPALSEALERHVAENPGP